jgi:exodeoxyribonuclease X
MSVYILDCETTGINKSDQVIELAYYKCLPLEDEISYLNNYTKDDLFNELLQSVSSLIYKKQFLPSCPINSFAQAVHGIARIQLLDKLPSYTVDVPDNIQYIIGHNISFDKRLLLQSNPKLNLKLDKVKYICTLNLARLLTKHLNIIYTNHKLDTLIEHYYPNYIDYLITPSHNAKGDVLKNFLVVLQLIKHLPNIYTWEDLYYMQEKIKEVRQ